MYDHPSAGACTTSRQRRDRDFSLSLHRLVGFDYTDPDHAYFVTTRARQGTMPFTDERLAADIVDALSWLHDNRGVTLYAYCLMPDHLHLLAQLADQQASLGATIGSLKAFTTRQSWELGYEGPLWQARFYDHILRRSEDGERIAKYILENPVRKGLVMEADVYQWSGTPDPM